MTEKCKESLSALMDNESNEMEFHRVLSNSDEEGLRQTWRRYHMTRTVLREGNIDSRFINVDISRQVGDAIEHELAHSVSFHASSGFRRYLKPVTSFALAASVAAIVVMAGQLLNSPTQPVGGGGNMLAETVVASKPSASGSVGGVGIRTVNYDGVANAASTATDRSAVYNNFARQRLQRFMLHNAEHAALNSTQGMMTFARVVNLEAE